MPPDETPSPDAPEPDDGSPAHDAAHDAPSDAAPEAPLLRLRDGLGKIVETEAGLAEVCAAMARGTGPVAIDAERASGYRYSSRAYLIQLRREGSGTFLVDPIAFGSLPTGDPAATVALDLAPHVEAWGELLCTAAGLPPVPDGVTVMPSRRGQRGSGL